MMNPHPQYLPPGNNNTPNNPIHPSQEFNGHHANYGPPTGPDMTQKMQSMTLNGPQGQLPPGMPQNYPPTSNYGQGHPSQGQMPGQVQNFSQGRPPVSQGQFPPQKQMPPSSGSGPQVTGPGFQMPPSSQNPNQQFPPMQNLPSSQAPGPPGQMPSAPQGQPPSSQPGLPPQSQMGPTPSKPALPSQQQGFQQGSGQPGMPQPGLGQRMPPQPGQPGPMPSQPGQMPMQPGFMPSQGQQPGFPGQVNNQGLPPHPGMPPQSQTRPGQPPQPGVMPQAGPPQQQGPQPLPGQQGFTSQPGQMPGQPGQMPGQPGQMPGQPGQMPGQPGQMPGQPPMPKPPGQPPMQAQMPGQGFPQPGMPPQRGQIPGQQPMPGLPPMPGQPPMPSQIPGQPPMPGQGVPSSQAYNQFQANLPHMPPQRYPGAPGTQPGFSQPPAPGPGYAGVPQPSPQHAPPGSFPQQPSSGYPPQQPPSGYPQQPQFPGQQPSYPNPQYQQPQKRLDPDQMPSPIQVMSEDQASHGGVFVTSEKGAVPPLVTTEFTVEDRGNASPRYMRSTMYSVPVTADLLKQTAMPFALVIAPMAETQGAELEPPLLDFAALTGSPTMGPVRCSRCKAYICPSMKFIDAGRHFKCAFCKATTEVPMEYTQYINSMQQYGRVPSEMAMGAYEIVATKEYCRNNTMPNPPAVVFCIDVSYNSVKNGLLQTICDNIIDIIDALPKDETGECSTRVGFITYSSTVHFYNIKGSLVQPQMLSVGDVSDMFVPLLEGFLVRPVDSGAVLRQLIQLLPDMVAGTRETETVLLPAVQAGYEALKAADTSGQLLVFHTSLPSYNAPGKLTNREDRKLLGTDKEKQILAPQTSVYNELAQSCCLAGVSVELFVCNNAYVDVATSGQLARLTGGQVHKYTYFTPEVDGARLIADVTRVMCRPTAHDAVMRVRTSGGVRPTDFIGHLYMTNTTDVELAAIDSDKAIGIEIKHDDKLTGEDGVYIQAALLYTHRSGQRRLRVLNLALNVAHQLADVYRSMELDTCINYLTKQAVWALREHPPRQVREGLSTRCAKSLAAYRRHCASPSSAGQLVLPESMKLLPLYTSCVLRSDAVAGGPDLTCDDRSCAMHRALTADVATSVVYTYPRLLPLHHVAELPNVSPLRATVEKMNDQGVYLLENGVHMLIWIGSQASPDFCRDVFGVASPQQVDTQVCELPELSNPVSEAVRSVVDDARSRRRVAMRLTVMRQHDKLEAVLRHFLVEDRGVDGSASYVDYLCHIHKEIRALL